MREETLCRHMGYSFRLAARVLLYALSHRQDSTYRGLCYASRGTLAETRNSPVHQKCGRTKKQESNLIVLLFKGVVCFCFTLVRWVVGSILHGVDPLSYFSFQPVLHDSCSKCRGMYYPVCGMMHIKEPLLLIGKSSLCGGSGFPLSLSEWSFTICLTPYNRK